MSKIDTINIHRAQHDKEHPYLCVNRDIPQNKDLSFEARGMLMYILSQKDTWDINLDDLQQGCGKDKARRILNELIDAGYIVTGVRVRNKKGKFTSVTPYQIYESPRLKNQIVDDHKLDSHNMENQDVDTVVENTSVASDNPHTEKPACGNPPQISNKKKQSNKKSTKNITPPTAGVSPLGDSKVKVLGNNHESEQEFIPNKLTTELKNYVAKNYFGWHDIRAITPKNWKLIVNVLKQIFAVHDANETTCTIRHLEGFLPHYRKKNPKANLPLRNGMEAHYQSYYMDSKAKQFQPDQYQLSPEERRQLDERRKTDVWSAS